MDLLERSILQQSDSPLYRPFHLSGSQRREPQNMNPSRVNDKRQTESCGGREQDRGLYAGSGRSPDNAVSARAASETGARPFTVKDVARLAGLSIATVSRVVNGSQNVSYEARAKVLSAISRLEYCPNPHAAMMGRSGSGIQKKRQISKPASAREASDPHF